MKDAVVVLAYAGCSTCKSALKWLAAHGVQHTVRPIVGEPPTPRELQKWVRLTEASGVGLRKWLNTSGQSYRAIDKEKIAAATDAELVKWLAADGKLVKRPVMVVSRGGEPTSVTVGFRAEAYEAIFSR